MIDYGHMCLLIFAQGTWKDNYKKRLVREVKNKFISNMDIDDVDLWSEIEKIPLFNPKTPEENHKPCELCYSLYDIFEKEKGNNDGIILFSHNILGWKGMKNFLLFILGEVNVKKIYYLELDQSSYLISTKKRISTIIKNIKPKQVNRSVFFDLFDKEKVEFSILYEVVKY